MIDKDCPCTITCPTRSDICHGKCKEYNDWAEGIRKRNKAARKDVETDVYIRTSINRTKKRRHLP